MCCVWYARVGGVWLSPTSPYRLTRFTRHILIRRVFSDDADSSMWHRKPMRHFCECIFCDLAVIQIIVLCKQPESWLTQTHPKAYTHLIRCVVRVVRRAYSGVASFWQGCCGRSQLPFVHTQSGNCIFLVVAVFMNLNKGVTFSAPDGRQHGRFVCCLCVFWRWHFNHCHPFQTKSCGVLLPTSLSWRRNRLEAIRISPDFGRQ